MTSSWAALANKDAQAQYQFPSEAPNQQMVPAGAAKPGATNSGWGALAKTGASAPKGTSEGGWGALANPPTNSTTSAVAVVSQQLQNATPVPKSELTTKEVVAMSNTYVSEATKGGGALSISTHNRQMEEIEELIKTMVLSVKDRAAGLSKLLNRFMEQVAKENDKISRFSEAITRRFEAGDNSLTSEDVLKAQAMTNFISSGVKLQRENIGLAISAAKEGSSTISDETYNAAVKILDLRTKQAALFSSKLDVIHKQEKHVLQLAIDKQKADMEAQKEEFRQLEETVKMLQTAQEGDHKRALELRKQQIEETIQLRCQLLKEEETRNKLELDLAAHQLEVTKVGLKHELDSRTLEIGRQIEQSKIRSNEIIKKFEAQKKAETDHHQIDATERTESRKTEAQKQAAMHQANVQGDVAKHQATTQLIGSVLKPPCSIQ